MTAVHETVAVRPRTAKRRTVEKGERGKWLRFTGILVITVIVLIPVGAVVLLSLRPSATSTSTAAITVENFTHVFTSTDTLTWLGNSLMVTLGTVLVSVAVAAPAGGALAAEPNARQP